MAAQGPFVKNTKGELVQGIDAFNNG
ncbi:MAG: hypothetical protein KBT58_09550 [Bizionia sp.]|nr:hypothetical protein [Bizionia sp.]